MALVNGHVAPTQFVLGEFNLPLVTENLYKVWHKKIEQNIKVRSDLKIMTLDNERDELVYFNHDYLHQATPATKRGWRWFGRVSVNNFFTQPRNEIRNQIQVYMKDPYSGW